MSLNVTQAYQTAYSSNVHKAYQQGSLLSETVRSDGKMIGDKIVFTKSGKIIAQKINMASQVIPGNTGYEQVVCQMEEMYAADYVYDCSKPKFNFEESAVVSENIGKAIGRAKDQIIIDNALAAAKSTVIGDASSYLSIDIFNKFIEMFNKKSIPIEHRFFACTPVHVSMLLKSTKHLSHEYNILKAIQNHQENKFGTFTFKMIEDRDEGGLRADTAVPNSLRCYAYSKDCIGFHKLDDLSPKIERIPQYLAYQHIATASIGAVNIEDEGIIRINTANSIDGMTGIDDALAVRITNPEDLNP